MSKDVAVKGSNLPANNDWLNEFRGEDGRFYGMEALDSSDLIIPKLKLCQNTSADGAPGKFFLNTTGETYDSVKVLLLKISKSRVMWPEQFKRNDSAECRSLDGVRKSGNGIGDGVCKTCRYAQWGPNKGDRPRCREGYTFLGIMADSKEPFILRVAGSSYNSVRQLNNKTLTKNIPYYAYTMELASEKVQNDKGVYYVIKFNLPTELNSYAVVKEAAEILQGLNHIVINGDVGSEIDGEVVDTSPVSTNTVSFTDDDIPF